MLNLWVFAIKDQWTTHTVYKLTDDEGYLSDLECMEDQMAAEACGLATYNS
jgi:hypothetical protein